MRDLIQLKLNELTSVNSGNFVPDAIIELGTTYFGYSIQEDYQNSDMDKNDTVRVSIIGFITRKNNLSENTLSIIDVASKQIKNKLKELNFKVSIQDITLSDDIRKNKVTGYAYYNEINNKLI